MKEFTTIAELAVAKTREEIVTWAAEMQKCPYDYEGEAFAEGVCKQGEDAEQCNQCWLVALTGIKCKGEEEEKPKRRTNKKKDTEPPKEELAAKDSNAGVLALKDLAKTMSKEEFLQNIKDNKICPSMYGFPNTMSNCQKHAISSQCVDCWKVIIDTLEFKAEAPSEGNTHNIEEVQEVNSSELVAPAKNDVKVLAHMDKLVDEIKNFKAQQKQWDELLKEKIAEATAKVEEEKSKLQRAIDYNMSQIVVEFPQVEAKETKTQKKVCLVSGDVILKKATEKIDYDKDKLLDYFKNSRMDYEAKKAEIQSKIDHKFDEARLLIDSQLGDTHADIIHEINCLRDDLERLECKDAKYIKTKEEADWGNFKKTLTITDGNVVDGDGVVLKIDGLSVMMEEEKLEIK